MSGVSVFLRQWITNAQVEYAQEPLERFAERRVIGVDDPTKPIAQNEAAARGREVFTEKIVVPADGDQPAKEITEPQAIKDFYMELPAVDVGFVNFKINELTEADKKKLETLTNSGQ